MEYKESLVSSGLKPSYIRLKVLEYLDLHKTHPTVEDIYEGLIDGLPTLSKTSVYNTVKVLRDAGLVTELTIDEKQVHYDGDTSTHAHFLCDACGKIFDIPEDDALPPKIGNFTVRERKVYYSGVCNRCPREQ